MLSKVKIFGQPGKLWTSKITDDKKVYNLYFLKITCDCGATTRKLATRNTQFFGDSLELPTVNIFTGGVGSFCCNVKELEQFECWNWSKRTGGYAIPQCFIKSIVTGHISNHELPEGTWLQVYRGNCISTFIEMRNGEIDGHNLKEECIERKCPVCQEKEFSDKYSQEKSTLSFVGKKVHYQENSWFVEGKKVLYLNLERKIINLEIEKDAETNEKSEICAEVAGEIRKLVNNLSETERKFIPPMWII